MECQDSLHAIEEDFPIYIAEVRGRLLKGASEYGDASIERSPLELIGELKEEVADICGWGFILWLRLQAIEKSLKSLPPQSQ